MGETIQDNEHRRERGWKLFLLPRLLLFRPWGREGERPQGEVEQTISGWRWQVN